MLGELYLGRAPLYAVDDAGDQLRMHILMRLRRLCSIPDDVRLADVSKQILKDVFAFKLELSAWKRAACCGNASTGASIAGGGRPGESY